MKWLPYRAPGFTVRRTRRIMNIGLAGGYMTAYQPQNLAYTDLRKVAKEYPIV
jgi:hypothetical protein